jgi:hypothetical protein
LPDGLITCRARRARLAGPRQRHPAETKDGALGESPLGGALQLELAIGWSAESFDGGALGAVAICKEADGCVEDATVRSASILAHKARKLIK